MWWSCRLTVTLWVSLVEQELLTSVHPYFFSVAQTLVFSVVFYRSLFKLLFFCHCVACPSSIYRFCLPLCVACPSSIYRFCLPFVLPVLLRFTDSANPFVLPVLPFTDSAYPFVSAVLLRFTDSANPFVSSVLLRFTDSANPFGIFKLFLVILI